MSAEEKALFTPEELKYLYDRETREKNKERRLQNIENRQSIRTGMDGFNFLRRISKDLGAE